jgi:hypothetical protein
MTAVYCTVCDKPREEVQYLITGPVFTIASDATTQLVVCDGCVAALDEVASTQPPGGDGERSGMHCSWCKKAHREVGSRGRDV